MGRVFTWDDVVQGRIPTLPCFITVRDRVIKTLGSDGGVHGAILLGSVIRGHHGVRSDIDVLVVIKEGHGSDVLIRLRSLVRMARMLFVPLEIIPVREELAKKGVHTITRSFYRSCTEAVEQGGLIGDEHLLERLYMGDAPSDAEEFARYTERKRQKFAKAGLRLEHMSPEQHAEYLGKALDAPIHAIRKLLCAYGDELPVRPASMSKDDVLSAYFHIATSVERGLLQQVLEADRDYSKSLEKLDLSRRFYGAAKNSYESRLGSLERAAEASRLFLARILGRYPDLLL